MNNQMLAARIREVREEKGYTQEDFSDILGISRQAYMRLEQGKRTISFVEIEKIASTIGEHYSIFTDISDESVELSLSALCRNEKYGITPNPAFEKIGEILDVFSAQENLYFQMKEVEK